MTYEDIVKLLNDSAIVYDNYDYEFEEYKIDDYVREDGVSYEEALEAFKAKTGGDLNDIT